MAAVLCLVLLPLMAAVGFMLGIVGGDPSPGALLGGFVFLMLGGGIFVGAYNMSRGWDGEQG